MITRQSVKAMALDDGDRCEHEGREYVCVRSCAWKEGSKATLRPSDAAIGDDSGDVELLQTEDVIWLQEHDKDLRQLSGWTEIEA